MRTWFAVGVIALALLAAACGGGDSSGTTSATPAPGDATTASDTDGNDPGIDVCTLFEDVDLDELGGEPMGDAESDGTACAALPASFDSNGLVSVGFDPDGADAYAEREEILAGQPVDGLGDEAFLTGTWLHVRAGDLFIDLQVMRDESLPEPTEDELVEAMRVILTNVGLD